MGKYTYKSVVKTVDGILMDFLDNGKFEKFDESVLGLGDLRQKSTSVEAMAAIFDLSGFTHFCSQVDPHLSVPEYLSRFLAWLFNEVKTCAVEKEVTSGKKLYYELPFMAKFLGDGVLFMWDVTRENGAGICNIVVFLSQICRKYKTIFYPDIKKSIDYAPLSLRCGIARGKVFSVGNGDDYVGPCINIASRLQKLSSLTLCVARNGFDFESNMTPENASNYVTKKVSLRGIGDDILIWVVKSEFNVLQPKEKVIFKAP